MLIWYYIGHFPNPRWDTYRDFGQTSERLLETNTSWRIKSTNKARVQIKVKLEILRECFSFLALLCSFVLVTEILVFYWNHAAAWCVRMTTRYYSLLHRISNNTTIPRDTFWSILCLPSSLSQIFHLLRLPVHFIKHTLFKEPQ